MANRRLLCKQSGNALPVQVFVAQSIHDLLGVFPILRGVDPQPDVVLLIVFGTMVWKAPRSWPVWACALQLLAVTSHIMIMADLRTPISAFYTVVNMTGYGIMLAIAIGTFWAWQERRAIGDEAE